MSFLFRGGKAIIITLLFCLLSCLLLSNTYAEGSSAEGFTVSYVSNGGFGTYESIAAESDAFYTVLDHRETGISRGAYTFSGWNTDPDGDGQAYEPGDRIQVDKDMLLFAQWRLLKVPDIPYIELDKLGHKAYMTGYTDGSFRPEGSLLRSETAMIFYRLLTDDSREDIMSTVNGFTDVKASDWHNTAISTLAGAGVLKGYNGAFNPNGRITRGEFISIAMRLSGDSMQEAAHHAGVFTHFNDTDGHWAEKDISLAASLGYVSGYKDGTFKPNNEISRAEAAAIVNKITNRTSCLLCADEGELKVWPDIEPSSWYYLDIQEATNTHE